ncbi:glycerol kinase [Limosa lapponica baueri]|uniref:Glycerol kinase n=1 Tax=Limosa lapponica baueri TaxID=1758121 RepID=A0A2I0T2I7_LIMLA|nr:glycerol kinase [Limosa lapponica baueri]
MIKGLENLPCEERPKELALLSLEKGQGDLITVFQYLKGSYKEDRGSLFTRSHMEKTRGNRYVLLATLATLKDLSLMSIPPSLGIKFFSFRLKLNFLSPLSGPS